MICNLQISPTSRTDLAKIGADTWPTSATWQHRRVATELDDLEAASAEYWAAQQAVDDAKAQVKASQQRFRDARGELNEAVVVAARRGWRMRELVDVTGLSREWIRQLLRAAGVEPD